MKNKRTFSIFTGVLFCSILCSGFLNAQNILPIEQWEMQQQHSPKPSALLFSTDWCSVCQIQKRELDKNDKDLRNDGFYLAIINPEKYKKDIIFLGKRYSYIANGTSGLHSLAYELMENNMPIYPYWIFIDSNNRITHYKGFLNEKQLENIIKKMSEK